MKKYVFLFVFSTVVGCSPSLESNSYCRAIASNEPTRELAVQDLYVYGTLEHGTILISLQCLRPMYSFNSLHGSASKDSGAVARVGKFNQAVYNYPGRASGMFKISGVVNVDPKPRVVELRDIGEFEEVDDDEYRSVIDLLRHSRD